MMVRNYENVDFASSTPGERRGRARLDLLKRETLSG
jgi:hypothetical protein